MLSQELRSYLGEVKCDTFFTPGTEKNVCLRHNLRPYDCVSANFLLNILQTSQMSLGRVSLAHLHPSLALSVS
jgi:hypothetical protein